VRAKQRGMFGDEAQQGAGFTRRPLDFEAIIREGTGLWGPQCSPRLDGGFRRGGPGCGQPVLVPTRASSAKERSTRNLLVLDPNLTLTRTQHFATAGKASDLTAPWGALPYRRTQVGHEVRNGIVEV
jgi:hypothetical protein